MNIRVLSIGPQFVRCLLLAVMVFGASLASSAAVLVSVNIAPPALPVYAQPSRPEAAFQYCNP